MDGFTYEYAREDLRPPTHQQAHIYTCLHRRNTGGNNIVTPPPPARVWLGNDNQWPGGGHWAASSINTRICEYASRRGEMQLLVFTRRSKRDSELPTAAFYTPTTAKSSLGSDPYARANHLRCSKGKRLALQRDRGPKRPRKKEETRGHRPMSPTHPPLGEVRARSMDPGCP